MPKTLVQELTLMPTDELFLTLNAALQEVRLRLENGPLPKHDLHLELYELCEEIVEDFCPAADDAIEEQEADERV